MIALILYLLAVVIWFIYISACLGENYEIAIVAAVFHPIFIAILYFILALFIIVAPISGIIGALKKLRSEEPKND